MPGGQRERSAFRFVPRADTIRQPDARPDAPAGALPRETNARAMRKTRLADQRDDVHCMSANSAVTLMKEAVDSAIKHGDIRLDAVWVASLSPPKDTDMQH